MAPDVDDRFVQAFACAGGRVVARRRAAPHWRRGARGAAAGVGVEGGPARPRRTLLAELAEQARIVSAALVRPGLATRPVAVDRFTVATVGERIAGLRSDEPLPRMNFGVPAGGGS